MFTKSAHDRMQSGGGWFGTTGPFRSAAVSHLAMCQDILRHRQMGEPTAAHFVLEGSYDEAQQSGTELRQAQDTAAAIAVIVRIISNPSSLDA